MIFSDMKKFVDREEEIKVIKERLKSKNFELIIIFGRRRVGKTRLVLECVKGSDYIYYLATERNNISKFKSQIEKSIPVIKHAKEDWEAIFNFLKDKTIIIDEFPNILREDRTALAEFQRIVDTSLINTKTKLILLGSSIFMMKSKILSYKSPLYGRSTSILELKPLKFNQIGKFFRNADIEELIKIYGFAGGVPFYLQKINKLPFFSWLEEEIKKVDSFLRYETDILLRMEFEDYYTYREILEAIASGKTKLNEIREYVKVKGEITKYLKNLIRVGFVKREVPITKKMKSKKGRYYVKDNFLKFWFRFIYPNISSIEERIFDINLIKESYNQYLGFIFEEICKEFLVEMIRKKKIPYFNKIGKEWGSIREKKQAFEIDIVALNEKTKEILFAECKWQSKVNALKIAKELAEKAEQVQWHNKERKESFAIFAKSFSKRIEELEGRKVYCFDLRDLKKITKKKF